MAKISSRTKSLNGYYSWIIFKDKKRKLMCDYEVVNNILAITNFLK